MKNKKEWLEARKTYLGGSDIAAICGVPSFKKTALDVYFSKVNPEIIELTKEDPNYEAAYWGEKQEKDIAERYSEEHNLEVRIEPKLIRHPKYPFMAGNIDRWVGDYEYILECKTAHFMKSKEYGDEGTDQIPKSYLCQVAWYSAITGVPKVDISVLIGGQDYREYTYTKDQEIEEKLIKIAYNFWHNHVEKRIPPKCTNLADTFNLFPNSNHKELTASENIVQKIYELKELKKQENDTQTAIDKLKVEIQEFMQDYDVLLNNSGCVVATWKNTTPRSFFDAKKLKEECHDIYQKYLNYTRQSRMFLIK
jgi:putative phage-type endonuclease